MRSVLLLSSGLLALAAPAPQDIEFDLVYALPNPTYSTASDVTAQTVSYTPNVIYSEALPQITATEESEVLQKRAACTALPTGAGPVASPDTPSNFMAIPDFASAALAAPTPSGYTQAFKNLNASNNAYGYLGYTTYKTYDVASCATKCNSISGCVAFNMYYERDPTVDPGSGDSGCANPPSTTFIKCAFWGGPVTAANANNKGQYRNQFQVVIAGSNGYVSNAIPAIPGYGTVIPLGTAAINAPYDSLGFDSYMGSAVFTNGPFDASLCARACTEKSNYNIAHPPTDGSPVQTCQFFNTYILYINSTSNPNNLQGQYCAMYSESWPKSYATNVGQTRGYDRFLIQYSFAYSNATNPGAVNANAAAHQASRDISYSTLQPFCSTYLGYNTLITTTTTTITSAPITTTTTISTVFSTASTIHRKRDDDLAIIATYPESILAMMHPPGLTEAPVDKRALPTPAVLTNYPSAILSSACSMQATPAPTTIISSTTTTLPVSVITSSTTTTAVVPTCTSFRLQIAGSGTSFDGAFIQQPDLWAYFTGISTAEYYRPFTDFVYTIDLATGLVTSPRGYYFGRYRTGGELSLGILTQRNNDMYGDPNQCALNPYTLQLTCTSTQYGVTYDTFYIYNYSWSSQMYMGPAGYETTDTSVKPIKLYAVCAAWLG